MSISTHISANCRVCGNKHKGNFYQCTTCFNFFAHKDCVFLRKKILIQNFRKDSFFHTHQLTLAYSFPKDDQKAKFDPRCKVCELGFAENLWIYKCERCRYYVHTDCATTQKKAALSAICLNQGTSAVLKNYSDSDYPDILHLPFTDQTDVLKHFQKETDVRESELRAFETNLTHPFHRHPLTLVDKTSCNDDITTPSSSRITSSSIHDSMKMVDVICNACIRPITNLPFYKCTASNDGCNFFLHGSCTRLPAIAKVSDGEDVDNCTLLPQFPKVMGVFLCYSCDLLCNGFTYKIDEFMRGYDVHCALKPLSITHKSHPNHLLLLTKHEPSSGNYCRMCLSDAKKEPVFKCEPCKFTIHFECAMLWPGTVSHKYDKHRLTLRYFPVENYSGDYFCEVCEEEFNPNGAFYHCDQCVQSMHPACCVSIPPKEIIYTPFCPDRGVAEFDNVKFGDIYKVNGHPHVVSFCRGVESDGECANCGRRLQDVVILKCLQCKFAIDRFCAEYYSPKPIV